MLTKSVVFFPGLIYLSLFIASKFAITIPFLPPSSSVDASAFTAFPSRTRLPSIKVYGPDTYELPTRNPASRSPSTLDSAAAVKGVTRHNQVVAAARRQAAAPPIYLLVIAVVPFFASVFIAGSRWWDFRHHGFDIIFGYLIGTVTAFFSFRYYHLPISHGAGWAWGPRSHDKAFWAGVGSFSYATDHLRGVYRSGDEEEALDAAAAAAAATTTTPDSFGRASALSSTAHPGAGVATPTTDAASRKGSSPDGRDQGTGYYSAPRG